VGHDSSYLDAGLSADVEACLAFKLLGLATEGMLVTASVSARVAFGSAVRVSFEVAPGASG
jgi:hypothetical protein